MRDIEKRLERLEARYRAQHGRACVVLQGNTGEDDWLLEDEWRRANPQANEPLIVWVNKLTVMPRPEYATRESLLDALPLAKRWLAYKFERDADGEQKRQAEEAEWRALCRLAEINYDAVEAAI